MFPLVTAVITTRARPRHVYEALASVHSETYPNVECVVVDDDGGFVSSDRAVRVVRGDMVSVGHARNVGLRAERGEFIIFLDDDDVALPNRIATLFSAAARNGADLCFGMTRRVIDGSAAVLPNVPTHLMAPGPIGFCDLLACAPHINAVLVRTETLRAVGGFDADASHFDDWSAWLRIADRNVSMCYVHDIVAEWRIHDGGLSGEIIQLRAMKSRLLALFDRLRAQLSQENARAIADARDVVTRNEQLLTYDDYANAMAEVGANRRRRDRAAKGRPTRLYLY